MTDAKPPVLELRDIWKTYSGPRQGEAKEGRKSTLSGVSINVRKGEIYGFVGLNGAGKTTSIKIALGLTFPDTGEIRWFGEPPTPQVFERIGFAPEKSSFYEFLTGGETLDFSSRLLSRKPSSDRTRQVLETVGLAEDRDKKVSAYSKGMQQRLALAAAMLHDPEVFILDEPSSGLDPLGRMTIKSILLDLRKVGRTVFFSTHILADVNEICDRIGVIHKGRMLYEGSLKEFNPSGGDLEKRFVELIRREDPTPPVGGM